MALDLLSRPEVRVAEHTSSDEENCLVCQCRPKLGLCGRYLLLPVVDGDWDPEDMCPECVRVNGMGCPGCGCRGRASCRRREPGWRPWWRRWL